MNVYLFAIILLLVFMTLVFAVALWLQDNSIVDIAYGLAFVLIGWAGYLVYGSGHPRQILIIGLVTLWGLRLAASIGMRKRTEQGEDSRYRQWRESWGESFVWRSFLQIFMLQGAVIFVVALPVLLTLSQPGGAMYWTGYCGLLLWLIGFSFEAVGDYQLLRFKRNPANRGKIMQTGLRRYTRHPNYFGEATLWWGIFLIALGSPHGGLAVISPLLIAFLLLKVSGIPMLEAKYESHSEFADYKQRTNAFFPWFPEPSKGGAHD